MRTIRLTNWEVSRLCRAYNTGVFIHKISYLPAAVPQKKFLRISTKCQNKAQFDK